MNKKGVTFVEILISVAVLSILVVAATNLFLTGVEVLDHTETVYKNISEFEYFFTKIKDDIQKFIPFMYAGVFVENDNLINDIFENSYHHNKLSSSVKSLITISEYPAFFNGASSDAVKLDEYFLYDDNLVTWFSSADPRSSCWNIFNKEKWERWLYNLPAFNWNDIGIFTNNGFLMFSLGDDFSYEKYKAISYFYKPDEKAVYYYKIKFDGSVDFDFLSPTVIAENVSGFNIKYYTYTNEEIPLDANPTYVIAGLVRYIEIEVIIDDSTQNVSKKKIFPLNINRMY